MNKLITVVIASLFSLCTYTAANAVEGALGVSLNKSAFGGYGKETNTVTVTEEYGAFADDNMSVFAEVALGDAGLTVGVEYTPGSISTPTNTNIQNNGSTGGAVSANGSNTGGSDATNTASADFEDLTTIYIMWASDMGLYSKIGYSHVDVATTENLGTGGSYNNVSTDGATLALGFQHTADTGIFARFEVSATAWDSVKASNTDDTTKTVEITDMASASASLKIGTTF